MPLSNAERQARHRAKRGRFDGPNWSMWVTKRGEWCVISIEQGVHTLRLEIRAETSARDLALALDTLSAQIKARPPDSA